MLDEANTAFIATLAASGVAPLHELSPSEARAAGAALIELHGRGPEMRARGGRRLRGGCWSRPSGAAA